MFSDPTTTIWHQKAKTDPFGIREKRMVFNVTEKLKGAYGSVEQVTRPIRGAISFVLAPLMTPIKAAGKGIQAGYRYVVKPVATGISYAGGTVVEAAAGVKDATIVPAVTLAVAPAISVKRKAWDVPAQSIRSIVAFFKEELPKAPGRWWEASRQAVTNTRKLISTAFDNALKNLDEVSGNIVDLHLIEATKNLVKSGRQTIRDVLINPVTNFLSPITEPVMPLVRETLKPVGALANSFAPYFTAPFKAIGQFWAGLQRIWNSPGHHLNWKPLELLRGEKGGGEGIVAHKETEEAPIQLKKGLEEKTASHGGHGHKEEMKKAA